MVPECFDISVDPKKCLEKITGKGSINSFLRLEQGLKRKKGKR